MYFNMSLSSLQVRLFPRENPLGEGLDCQLAASAPRGERFGKSGRGCNFFISPAGEEGRGGGGVSKSATAP